MCYNFQAVNRSGKVIFSVKAMNEVVARENLYAAMSDKERAAWKTSNFKVIVFPS